MSNTTPHAPTLNGVPHLGRAEAVLYLILFYLFGHVHPRYSRYIDAVGQHDRLGQICKRADTLRRYWDRPNAGYAALPRRTAPLWQATDLPDIYFALLFAWRLVKPRPWAGLRTPAQNYQIFPALEPD